MGKLKIMMIFLAVFTLFFGGCIYTKIKNSSGVQNVFKMNNGDNWKWNDDWNGNGPKTKPKKSEEKKPVERVQKVQVIAETYQEALKKSEELGKPVFVFFTADWCGYCQKMKSETMSKEEVKEVLKNYIVVYINADRDRDSVKKMKIESLPSFVITNHKDESLKTAKGFMDAKTFSNWLNDSKLFN
jgi:thiol:disulfide interchange protein